MLLGIVFAILSGTCGTLAAIAVSLPVHYAKADKRELSASTHAASVSANLALTGAGVVLGILACSQGPVSIIFPLSVAAGLTSNMILQGGLGLAKYTNASIVGTLVLVFAVMQLQDVGAPPMKTESEDEVLGMMMKFKAIAYIAISLSVNVACLTALYLKKVTGNMAMLFAFALVGGTGTVLNTSIQKLMSMAIPIAGKCFLGLVWVTLSCVCLGSGAMANGSLEDPSKFVPISNGVNLVLNCFAGLCIWGDGPRLIHPTSYAIVYVLVVLGTYLVSSIDIFSVVHLQVTQAVYDHTQKGIKRGLTQQTAKDPALMQVLTRTESDKLRASVQLHEWPHLEAAVELVGTRSLPDFEKRLMQELDQQMLSHAEVASLCSKLLERLGGKDGDGQECLAEWASSIRQ